jgi:hypothetical protein
MERILGWRKCLYCLSVFSTALSFCPSASADRVSKQVTFVDDFENDSRPDHLAPR